jgi:hypothetical protein
VRLKFGCRGNWMHKTISELKDIVRNYRLKVDELSINEIHKRQKLLFNKLIVLECRTGISLSQHLVIAVEKYVNSKDIKNILNFDIQL